MRAVQTCFLIILLNILPFAGAQEGQNSESASVDGQPQARSLEVIDPYLEMRSGPGRGYPVFFVIEEGERVEVLVRQPGWYEVRAANGRVGWVAESQIARTMQASGEPADLPSVSYGDYLNRGWQVGFSTGQFSSGGLNGADTIKANIGYRPLSWFVIEAETARYFAPETKGSYSSLNLVVEPFSKNRWSPAIIFGTGQLDVESQPELTPIELGTSDYQHYGLRLNYYVGRNFLIKAEYKTFDVEVDTVNEEMRTWYLGFNTFF